MKKWLIKGQFMRTRCMLYRRVNYSRHTVHHIRRTCLPCSRKSGPPDNLHPTPLPGNPRPVLCIYEFGSFFRLHIHSICPSLSDMSRSAKCPRDPSMLLQKAEFPPFYGWMILHYIAHSLYPCICRWTLSLFSCLGCCKGCCSERGGTVISFR